MYKRETIFFCQCLAIFAFLIAAPRRASAATLVVDGAKTYQTIEGFGVNANYFAWNNADLQPALDALIDDAGMTQFRIIFNNGWETNNDNADSNLQNWNYYNSVYSAPNAQKLWGMMAYLNQRGITNGITLNFQGPGPSWMMNGSRLATGYEDEWAEMISSLLLYARFTNNLQFNLVAPHNEPDITGEGINIPTVSQYLLTLHSLAQKLSTNGLSDMLMVAPDRSTSNTNWVPEIMSDPLIMSKLGHFGMHSYSSGGTGSQNVSNTIARSAYPDRTFWMTEFNVWCDVCEYGASGTNNWLYSRGTADYILGHLANGASAGMVWEGYDSYYPHHSRWSYWGLLAVVNTNATPKVYTPRKGFYTLAQIAKFVRPGAKRVDTSGSISPLVALGFYHTNTGQFTIVGENTGNGSSTLSGRLTNLPPIKHLDLYYTDANTNLYHSTTISVTNGLFSIPIPGSCIYTLVGIDEANSSVSVNLTNPVDGAVFASPANILLSATVTSSTGTVSTVQFQSNGVLIGQATNAPYQITWSNVPPGIYTVTASATNSLGHSDTSVETEILVSGPATQVSISPPSGIVVPYGTLQYTGLVQDALGIVLDPQPPISWSVNGGGTVDGDGTFVGGGIAGGPFTITASSLTATGTATITVSTNVNIAPDGTGYFWYSLTSPNSNSPQANDDSLNDGDLITDVVLGPGGKEDIANAYEAAGIIWPTPRNINRVVYINGSYNSQHDGSFAAEFGLQLSTNGTSWFGAGTNWIQTPAYSYNSNAVAYVPYTFNGPATFVRGVRGIGKVHTSSSSLNSWLAFAAEVQAFAAPETPPASPLPPAMLAAMPATNLIAITWPAALTNYVLESCSDPVPPSVWSPVTNTPEVFGDQSHVWLDPSPGFQFFRLRQQ